MYFPPHFSHDRASLHVIFLTGGCSVISEFQIVRLQAVPHRSKNTVQGYSDEKVNNRVTTRVQWLEGVGYLYAGISTANLGCRLLPFCQHCYFFGGRFLKSLHLSTLPNKTPARALQLLRALDKRSQKVRLGTIGGWGGFLLPTAKILSIDHKEIRFFKPMMVVMRVVVSGTTTLFHFLQKRIHIQCIEIMFLRTSIMISAQAGGFYRPPFRRGRKKDHKMQPQNGYLFCNPASFFSTAQKKVGVVFSSHRGKHSLFDLPRSVPWFTFQAR